MALTWPGWLGPAREPLVQWYLSVPITVASLTARELAPMAPKSHHSGRRDSAPQWRGSWEEQEMGTPTRTAQHAQHPAGTRGEGVQDLQDGLERASPRELRWDLGQARGACQRG